MKLTALLLALTLSLGALAQDTLKPGEVQLRMPGGGTYIGSVSAGVPDGKGYFRDADGMQYEGEVRMGKREGTAEGMFPNGDRYKGEWKDGKPDGAGTMTYMLGGAFEGRWRAGFPDGRGTMTFAGSGRRAEVEYVGGKRLVAMPRAERQPGEKTSYAILSEDNMMDSLRKAKLVTSAVPLHLGYDGLSPAQKQIVRASYPALDEGDEPPYPLNGIQDLYSKLQKLAGHFQLVGDIDIYVLVGADAKVQWAATSGIDDPEAKRLVALAAAQIPYRPARCGGKPCQMMTQFRSIFGTRDR